MRTIRIHTEQALKTDQTAELERAPAKHLVKVLRQRIGYRIALFNGDGLEYFGTISAIGPGDRCAVDIESEHAVDTESSVPVTLVQAVARGDRMDWSIQKACELGVTAILPVFTERTEVRLDDKRAAKRQRHWQQVAVASCEQSGRVRVPTVSDPVDLTALDWPAGRRLHLDPRADTSLTAVDAPGNAGFVIVIGPEGGFTEAEVGWLTRQDSLGVRLGPRVLRTETAGPAALAAIQTRFGDWQ